MLDAQLAYIAIKQIRPREMLRVHGQTGSLQIRSPNIRAIRVGAGLEQSALDLEPPSTRVIWQMAFQDHEVLFYEVTHVFPQNCHLSTLLQVK